MCVFVAKSIKRRWSLRSFFVDLRHIKCLKVRCGMMLQRTFDEENDFAHFMG